MEKGSFSSIDEIGASSTKNPITSWRPARRVPESRGHLPRSSSARAALGEPESTRVGSAVDRQDHQRSRKKGGEEEKTSRG